jgi:hypothetical protein
MRLTSRSGLKTLGSCHRELRPRLPIVTIAELLSKPLEIEPAKQDKGSQMRAAAIMRRLGWHKDKQWHMGTWQRDGPPPTDSPIHL